MLGGNEMVQGGTGKRGTQRLDVAHLGREIVRQRFGALEGERPARVKRVVEAAAVLKRTTVGLVGKGRARAGDGNLFPQPFRGVTDRWFVLHQSLVHLVAAEELGQVPDDL